MTCLVEEVFRTEGVPEFTFERLMVDFAAEPVIQEWVVSTQRAWAIFTRHRNNKNSRSHYFPNFAVSSCKSDPERVNK
jgi:hypothetical protein